MSIALLSKVTGLVMNPSLKLTLMVLAKYANDEGEQCYPSVKTIVSNTGYSLSTVKRCLRKLCLSGYISRYRDTSNQDYYQHYDYVLRHNEWERIQNMEQDASGYPIKKPRKVTPVVDIDQEIEPVHPSTPGVMMNPPRGHSEPSPGVMVNPYKSYYKSVEKSEDWIRLSASHPEEKKISEILSERDLEKEKIEKSSDQEIENLFPKNEKGNLKNSDVTKLYKAYFQKYYPENFFKLTTVEQGMLNQMQKEVGPEFPKVLANVLKNWAAFTLRAEKNAGAFKSPLMPTVPYLRKYSAVAVDYWEYMRPREDVPNSIEIDISLKADIPEGKSYTSYLAAIAFGNYDE